MGWLLQMKALRCLTWKRGMGISASKATKREVNPEARTYKSTSVNPTPGTEST